MEVYQVRNRLVIGFTLGSSRPARHSWFWFVEMLDGLVTASPPPLYWYHALVTSALVTSALKIVLMDSWSKPQMTRKIKSESEVQPTYSEA